MERSLRRQIATLSGAIIVLTLAWIALAAWVALRSPVLPQVLSVERLDIVEPDGQLAFVLANSRRPVAATIDGHVLMEGQEEERRVPSFIFFDGKGDEVGGMLFVNRETEDGFQALRHLSLDGYKQDQTVVLAHRQDPDGAAAGLFISDRSEEHSILDALVALELEPGATREEFAAAMEAVPEEDREAFQREYFGVHRLFVGSDAQNQASLVLRDGQGRPRIVLSVPEAADPSIRVLDEHGAPVLILPE